MSTPLIAVRPAAPSDLEAVWTLILELAEYEKLLHQCTGTSEQLGKALFGSQPVAEAILAFVDEAPAGMAIYYRTFSTFAVKPILFLEDFFVRPAFRRLGLGQHIFRKLAARADALDCEGMEWIVLDWNRLAIDFYRKLGAQPQREWVKYRLGPAEISALAQGGALNEIAPEVANRPGPDGDAEQKS